MMTLFLNIQSYLLALICIFSLSVGQALAQDDAAPAEAVTQGDAAVILARKLGVLPGTGGTPQQAVQLLSARGIAPLGGWSTDDPVSTSELARLLGQALGLDGEFSDQQKTDPDAQAYKDLLLEQYGLDVDEQPGAALTSAATDQLVDQSVPSNPTQSQQSDDQNNVTQGDLEAAIAALVPSEGGGGASVAGGYNAALSNTDGRTQ